MKVWKIVHIKPGEKLLVGDIKCGWGTTGDRIAANRLTNPHEYHEETAETTIPTPATYDTYRVLRLLDDEPAENEFGPVSP